ncbi:NAD(P)-binding domain-containing protein [Streptomyces pactum]|uniref:NAD(P)-binding domain-containing protein n=1 Tax=Streptomyces pactum TaxID=68249 RepID=A0ABS0NHV2_9ACTN|nr:NAD(P)-binding domain-containing protein [Streptomyces pactum]MBH5334765.1 NAD(P)-binding domain-containing protein [Streptomyces pactum]
MRIGILGNGNMAGALGAHWVRAGHRVRVGGRSPERAAELARQIGAESSGQLNEIAGFGDATLLAVPYGSAAEVVRETGGALAGRVLIDCTNPVGPGFVLTTAEGPSGARRIADASGARVVKAFNLCADSVWRHTPVAFADGPLAVPLCGDDEAALETVRALVRDVGGAPLDAGGLDRAGLLEATTAFLIGLWVGGHDPRTMLPPTHAMA